MMNASHDNLDGPPPSLCLVLNPGSSTLKYAWFEGQRLGSSGSIEIPWTPGVESAAYRDAFITICKGARTPDVVGYRVVHGCGLYTHPTRIDRETLAQLESLVHLAPLHQPPAIATMRAGLDTFPHIPHVACFDTAFHETMPESEKRFAIPRSYYEQGIRRYGFHGLSYESIAEQLLVLYPESAPHWKTVVCHLGSGASVCGMMGTESRYTSMGFTPLDGLIMATRAGRVDPGLLLHWLQSGMSRDDLTHLLTKRSGLLGLSGISPDMRQLEQLASSNPDAQQAIELFCLSIAKEIAMAATALGGLDTIVFTGGIGENSQVVQNAVANCLHWIGVRIHVPSDSNGHGPALELHRPDSAIRVLRLPSEEQKIIASHAIRVGIQS